MKFIAALLFVSSLAQAYVPTVEGLFRHGANPDVATNALVWAAKVSPFNPFEDKSAATGQPLWIKWVYNVTPQGKLKITQLTFTSAQMGDESLVDKVYLPEFGPRNFSATQVDKGLFFSLANSFLINDGSFMVDFLRQSGVPAKANREILNQEKIQLAHRYRAWLAQTKGGRQQGSEESPLSPTSSTEKERVSQIMSSPMYYDQKQVSLSRFQGEPAWNVKADSFEAWVDDSTRNVKMVTMKSAAGDIEIQAREHFIANGTHRAPRVLTVKTALDQHFRIETVSLKHFNETGSETLARLRRYDQATQKNKATADKPPFML